MSTQISRKPAKNKATRATDNLSTVTGVPNTQEHVCPYCGRCKYCHQPIPPVVNPVYPQPYTFPNIPPWPNYPSPYIGDLITPP